MHKVSELIIQGIQSKTIIGCNHHERQLSQAIELDLVLRLAEQPHQDVIGATVNYSTVCQLIQELVPATNFLLLESLAEYLAQQLLQAFPLLNHVDITIGKPEIYKRKANEIKFRYCLPRTFKVALALGSNLNNPRQQLISATEFLSEFISDMRIAPIYKSRPQGFEAQEDFYNTCVSGFTQQSPVELLRTLKKIEKLMGKAEQFANGPRIIDLDLVFYADWNYQVNYLQIPHPRIAERDFVLRPLAAIEPEWVHPRLGRTVSELLAELTPAAQFILELSE